MHAVWLLLRDFFFLLVCFIPVLALAQDDVSRLIDLPDVENDDKAHTMTTAVREALTKAGHIVFTQEEMAAAARENGFNDGYWFSNDDIAKVNKRIRHDAVVRLVNQSRSVVIYVHNAYTGEVLAELERALKKKNKLTKNDASAIAKGVTSIVSQIDPAIYPPEITITVRSVPSGATVSKNGAPIGTTPFQYQTVQDASQSERWVVSYPNHEPVEQTVTLDKDQTFDLNLHAVIPTQKRFGKIGGSTGRPIFAAGFNIAPTVRSLKADATITQKGLKPVEYTTSAFATYSFDIEFYPFPLALDIDYLQGLGIIANIGFGFLSSEFELNDGGTKCKLEGELDGKSKKGTYTCSTDYLRLRTGLIYKLLLQKNDGRLDPDGLAIDFIAAFHYENFDVQSNNIYAGHSYKGLNGAVRFSAPLGLSFLRLAVSLGFYANFGGGEIEKTTKWGNKINLSWGVGTGISLLYDIWKGIYARVGYDFTYMQTNFAGHGSIGTKQNQPIDAKTKDFYHEIMIGIGYMLY